MHQNPFVVSPTSQGRFWLPEAQAIFYFARSASRALLHPDCFDDQGCWSRLVDIEEKPVAIKVLPSGTLCWSSPEHIEEEQVKARLAQLFIALPLPQEALMVLPETLATRFRSQMPLTHMASPSLGEAVIKAVIRQVISASHARRLLHRFLTVWGPSLFDGETHSYGFPSLKQIAQLSSESLQAEGLGYKSRLLPRIASDLLEQHIEQQMTHLSHEALVERLQQVKGIGRWTARVAVCDVTGDWSVYPFEDLAVRTWAARLWPEYAWPKNEKDFLSAWKEVNGIYAGVVTFYLLAQAQIAPQSESPGKQLALF